MGDLVKGINVEWWRKTPSIWPSLCMCPLKWVNRVCVCVSLSPVTLERDGYCPLRVQSTVGYLLMFIMVCFGWESSHLGGSGSREKWMLVFHSFTFSSSPSYSVQTPSPLPPTFCTSPCPSVSCSSLKCPCRHILKVCLFLLGDSSPYQVDSKVPFVSVYPSVSLSSISFSHFIVLEQF